MLNRRRFMGRAVLFAALPLLPSATYAYAKQATFYSEPVQTLAALHVHLFPAQTGAPAAERFNATGYLLGVLEDELIAKRSRDYLLNGTGWLNDASKTRFELPFYALQAQQREAVLREIVQHGWGESWLWEIMAYLFEALLGDPLYGCNADGIGWKWLEHEPGYPRPKKAFI